jgi:hypothetical protein
MNVSAFIDDAVPPILVDVSPTGDEGGVNWVDDRDRDPDHVFLAFLPT